MDKLSVIIPCYNHGKYLRECLQSVYDNYLSIEKEVIIVDDCSTDNSFEIVKNLSDKYDFKFYQMEHNSKPSKVRNRGISLSSGNLIVCLDGDDKIPINYFQENYNNILMYNVDVSYNNSVMFGSINKEINWPDFNIEIIRRNPFVHCASMFRRHVWEMVGGFDESMLDGWEDYDFWLSATKIGIKFKKCNSTYLYYRQSGNGHRDNSAKSKLIYIKEYLRKKHKDFYLGV